MKASRCNMVGLRAELAVRSAEIAKTLLGQPNAQLSSKRQLRFGRKGSLVVVTAGPKTGNRELV
jgi:putative DNA primase/helicase